MTDWTHGDTVIDALNRLIEANQELMEARDRLEEYKSANPGPPSAPPNFNDVNELLLYNRRKASYDSGLASAENDVHQAKIPYVQAAADVGEFLPVGSQVIHDYDSKYAEHLGKRYAIKNDKRSGVVVTSEASAL